MQTWMTLMLVVQMLTAMVMIGLVLIQHGKGADMGASFGGGASGSLFGATGSANFLSRSTAVCAAIFFATTLALAFMSNDRSGADTSGGSVLDRAAPAASAPAEGVIPSGIPAPTGAIAPAVAPADAQVPAPAALPASPAAPAIPTK